MQDIHVYENILTEIKATSSGDHGSDKQTEEEKRIKCHITYNESATQIKTNTKHLLRA